MRIIMKTSATLASASIIALTLHACGDRDHAHDSNTRSSGESESSSEHRHATDAHGHDDHDHSDAHPLGKAMIGDIEIEAWQGHGRAAAGKELHLALKIPHTDSGATTVRVWVGTENRFASVVERASYSSSRNGYSTHVTAPDPLPENAAWWIEITKPDGSVHLGSMKLL